MAKKTLKIGIVGTGGIGSGAHMPAYAKVESVKMTAVCDVNEARAKEVAEKFGVPKVYSDYNEMFKSEELDGVSVCTQNRYHAPVTIAALNAGINVLCEKPIAMNVDEATAMVKAAKKNDKQLMIGMVNRYAAASQFIKQAVDEGLLGDIYHANVLALRRRGIPGWGVFYIKTESGGGPIIDIGVHMLDLTLYFMGFPKPVTVSGVTYAEIGTRKPDVPGWGGWDPKKYDVEDYAAALVRFDNGASLVLRASWAANLGNEQMNSELYGTKGGARWNPCEVLGTKFMSTTTLKPDSLPQVDNFYEQIKAFCESVRTGKPNPSPGEQALVVQTILDGIYSSSEQKKELAVKVPTVK